MRSTSTKRPWSSTRRRSRTPAPTCWPHRATRSVFDGSNSFDRDGTIASYRWDFSDRDEPATDRVVTRTYAAPGVYSARLTVTDDSGAINGVDQDELAIRINHAPVANAGHDQFTSSNVVAFDGSASADADGDALVYSWDFGDGSAPVGGVRATHTYADGGTYPVVLDGRRRHRARQRQGLGRHHRQDRPPAGRRCRRQSRGLRAAT